MKTKLALCLATALAVASGCSKKTVYQAIVEVTVTADCVGPNKLPLGKITLSDADFARNVEELKLAEKWSTPSQSVSKEDAIRKLKAILQLSPNAGGFMLRVIGGDPAECELIAKSVSSAIKTRSEEAAAQQLDAGIASRQKELDALQEQLSAKRKELVEVQKGAYVPSQYRLTPEYEAGMEAKIRAAKTDDDARAGQLASLKQMHGDELRGALLKIELEHRAATNLPISVSTLLTADHAQKGAIKELESARSGASLETNAVGHAELKLEQANRNLTNAMDAYIQSLEIESEVSKTRHLELEKQLDKLRQQSRQSGEKAAVEKDIETLNARWTVLASEIEQTKLCKRMLADAIQIGAVQVEPVHAR